MVVASMRRRLSWCVLAAALLPGCAFRSYGINRMADALSATAGAYATDADPEFVRLAAPSTLKMVEMLLEDQPAHRGLLLSACSGFTQYAYGFLHLDSEIAAPRDAAQADALRARGARMYERARGYCLRLLEADHPGIGAALRGSAPAMIAGVARTSKADVPALFWAGASWAGEISLSENQLSRLNELAAARVLLERALTLDETWEHGAVHEALIALDGLPPLVGGSAARARRHFERAVAISGGMSAFAYVTAAASVARPAKDRREFERLLKAALAIDVDARPGIRLANLIAQKRARFLLSRADALF
jgi:hypothetical protein